MRHRNGFALLSLGTPPAEARVVLRGSEFERRNFKIQTSCKHAPPIRRQMWAIHSRIPPGVSQVVRRSGVRLGGLLRLWWRRPWKCWVCQGEREREREASCPLVEKLRPTYRSRRAPHWSKTCPLIIPEMLRERRVGPVSAKLGGDLSGNSAKSCQPRTKLDQQYPMCIKLTADKLGRSRPVLVELGQILAKIGQYWTELAGQISAHEAIVGQGLGNCSTIPELAGFAAPCSPSSV